MGTTVLRGVALVLVLGATVSQLSGCAPAVAVGAGAGIMIAEDRRTFATYMVDQEIELKAASRIRESFGREVNANTASFNRRVLLTGEVPDADTRSRVQAIVQGVPNVREVQNELLLGSPSTLRSRGHDAYLSTRVKARMFEDTRFNAHHVKVETEAGTVFLMGQVTRAEGAAAAEVASRTRGVEKVVKVFEYTD